MASEQPTVHDIWFWPRLLKMLDQMGLTIVRKPQLIEQGKPKPRPYV